MKKIFPLLLIISFLGSCGYRGEVISSLNNANKIIKLEYVGKIEFKDQLKTGFMFGIGITDNFIYFLHEKSNYYYISLFDINDYKLTKEIRRIHVNKGKGPGEVISQYGCHMFDKVFYIYDIMRNKFVLYNLDGLYEDEYKLNGKDYCFSFIVMNKILMFSGMMKYKFAKYDLLSETMILEKLYDQVETKINPNKIKGMFIKKYNNNFLALELPGNKLNVFLIDVNGNIKKDILSINGEYFVLNIIQYEDYCLFNKPTKINETLGENKLPSSDIETIVININNIKHEYNLEYNDADVDYSYIIPLFVTNDYLYYKVIDKTGQSSILIFKNPINKI